ncbi:ATP-binding protein [Streptomyces tricolor]|nr:ATP-binding protein [Streptomyces tricolor]
MSSTSGAGDFRGPVIGRAEYRQQAPAPTALDALPPPAAGFTGRDEELGRLRAALDPSGAGGEQAVLVTAVSGLGGIGKTALAVRAAYAAREEGWFPGGVLFLDLHGYDDAPVTADQALQSLLRALGVEPEHIPVTADERAGAVPLGACGPGAGADPRRQRVVAGSGAAVAAGGGRRHRAGHFAGSVGCVGGAAGAIGSADARGRYELSRPRAPYRRPGGRPGR